jgi:nicotinamide-nucleotide amidase
VTTAEIIAIGNELLLGDVLDTNANWLCKQITGVGGSVQRVVQVRDDRAAIVRELRSALSRTPALIFTTGGLGPTADDLTLAAVAEALNRPLVQHPDAFAMVQNTFAALAQRGYVDDARMTPERAKMAMLPQGAVPLQNTVGAAPGVALRLESTSVICLPGVPKELRAIYEGALQPLLRPLFGDRAYMQRLIIAHSKDESVLAPLLKAVADRHPDVYVKSRAREYGPEVTFRVTLSAAGRSQGEVAQRLAAALDDLRGTLARAQIATTLSEE